LCVIVELVLDIGRSLAEVTGLTHGKITENEENIVLVSGAVQNLLSVLGPAVEMDAKFEAPMMWGTTSFIGDEVLRLAEEVELSQKGMSMLKDSVVEVTARIVKAEASKMEADPKMVQILTMVMNRIQVIGPELDKIRYPDLGPTQKSQERP
jgi:hypothetical protein